MCILSDWHGYGSSRHTAFSSCGWTSGHSLGRGFFQVEFIYVYRTSGPWPSMYMHACEVLCDPQLLDNHVFTMWGKIA